MDELNNSIYSKSRFPPYSLLAKVFTKEVAREILMRLYGFGWQSHVNRSVHKGEWDVIALRCPKLYDHSHPILQCFSHEGTELNSADAWTNLPIINLFPEILTALNQIQCPIKSVRFMRLHAGASILPHCDTGVSLSMGEARLHLPLSLPKGVSFYVAGKRIPMMVGKLYYIDANREHWVINNGTEERVHLVVDCIANQWIEKLVLCKYSQVE